jgi:hypothetical protein
MQRSAALVATLLAAAGWARGETHVLAGDHRLLPDTPGQEISIQVSGDETVSGFELYLQMTGGPPAPAFQSADCYSDTIFAGHEGGYYTISSFVHPQMLGQYGVTDPYVAEEVLPSGTLATVTVSTEGVTGGTFDLLLEFDHEGTHIASNFAGLPATLTNGTITVIPEPATLPVLLAAGGWLARRRRRTAPPRPPRAARRP